MNSADSWREDQKPWPQDPDGDMTPILAASIDMLDELRRASMERHPAGKGFDMPSTPTLTAHDRCDGCGAQAYYKVAHEKNDDLQSLLFCGHHFRKSIKNLTADGWIVVDGAAV
jgi:hypothetical protein